MVWLDPTSRCPAGDGRDAWLSINDEAYFALQQYQPHLDPQGCWKPSERFRIVLKASSGIIVAVDDSLEGIFEHWEWIEENLLTQVAMFDEQQETLQFIILKLTSMAKLQMNERSLASALPLMSPRSPRIGMRTRTSPTKLGKESSPDSDVLEETFGVHNEHVVEKYENVSVWMKTQHKGTLYITSGHMCFQSSRTEDYIVVIPVLQMTTVTCKENCKLLGGEIAITTAEGSICIVSGLEDREEVYTVLTELRRIAMVEHLIGVEKAMVELNMEFESVSTTSKPLSNPVKPSEASSVAPRTGCPVALDHIRKEHLLKSQASLQYHETFRLPRTERLWPTSFNCTLSVRGSPVDRTGEFYCSEHFICFYGSEDTVLSIPTSAIRRMEGHMSGGFGKFVVYMEGETDFTFSAVKKGSVLKEVLHLWDSRWRVTCAHNDVPVLTLGDLEAGDIKGVWSKGKGVGKKRRAKRRSDRLSVQIRQTKEKQNFFDAIIDDVAQEQAEEWLLLQDSQKDGVVMLTPELVALVRSSGLPKARRGRLWYLYSGARSKQLASPMEYQLLLQECEGKTTVATDEIERDLCRTFPEHPFFQKEEGIDALRRVLTAYAFRNPAIGYCQSMNIVCALMIMFMPEEHAFWAMTAVCEDLVPDYYSPSMAGSATDQQVLEYLLGQHMPELRAHLDALNIPVALVSIPWFLCLFIGSLSWDTTVRILDCFFVEGKHVFFQFALAVFKCTEAAVLALQDTSEVIEVLKNTTVTCQELLSVAFGEFSFVDQEFVENLEETFCRQVLKDLEVKVEKRRQAAALQLTKAAREPLNNSCTGLGTRPHAATSPDIRLTQSSPTVPAIDLSGGDGDGPLSPSSTRAKPSGPRGTSGVNVGRHRNTSLLSSVLSRKSSSDGYSNLESVRKGRAERKKERGGVLLAREYRSSRDLPIRLSQRFRVADIESMLSHSERESDKAKE